MTIAPDWLHDAVALVTGHDLPPDAATELAEMLCVEPEVLPWLMLRANAFADYPDLDAAIRSQASRTPHPATRRPPALQSAGATLAAQRMADDALRQIVAENCAAQELGDETHGLLHACNRAMAGLPGYDFASHIGRGAEPDHQRYH
ncbi:hypothetical protein [Novosphingobium sp.]|uniref:hypothetical protein n=1 Tax=Novosphingobium sp. TaxID=1874826 RepID=UPI0033406873